MGDAAKPLKYSIKVDEDVWAYLQGRAVPFVDGTPNDVLRRELLDRPLPAPAVPTLVPLERKPGALSPALKSAALKTGDVLVCVQPRLKRSFKATVMADGWIDVIEPPKGEFDKPSPALAACTGSQINGWGNWVLERSGETLQKYRY